MSPALWIAAGILLATLGKLSYSFMTGAIDALSLPRELGDLRQRIPIAMQYRRDVRILALLSEIHLGAQGWLFNRSKRRDLRRETQYALALYFAKTQEKNHWFFSALPFWIYQQRVWFILLSAYVSLCRFAFIPFLLTSITGYTDASQIPAADDGYVLIVIIAAITCCLIPAIALSIDRTLFLRKLRKIRHSWINSGCPKRYYSMMLSGYFHYNNSNLSMSSDKANKLARRELRRPVKLEIEVDSCANTHERIRRILDEIQLSTEDVDVTQALRSGNDSITIRSLDGKDIAVAEYKGGDRHLDKYTTTLIRYW